MYPDRQSLSVEKVENDTKDDSEDEEIYQVLIIYSFIWMEARLTLFFLFSIDVFLSFKFRGQKNKESKKINRKISMMD